MARRRAASLAVRYWASWLHDEARAILPLVGLLAVGLGIYLYALDQVEQPAETIDAVVLGFGMTPEAKTPLALVRVRMPDGRVRHLRARRASLLRCSAGAPIRLLRRGRLLDVHPVGCRIGRNGDSYQQLSPIRIRGGGGR